LQGALSETANCQLLNWVLIWNPAEFIETPGRAPPTTLDSVLQSDVERRAIHAGLSARNNFHDHFCSGRRVACILDLSVASRNDVRALDHQDDGSFRRACAMAHTFGNNEALLRCEIDNAILEIDQKTSVQN